MNGGAGGFKDALISAPVALVGLVGAVDEHQVVIKKFSHEVLCFEVVRGTRTRLTRNLSVS